MKYSFIYRVKDRQALLAHSLPSVNQQSFSDFEVIVVDCSSEEPVLVPEPVKLIRLEEPGWNASIALNVGIANASGRFLVVLDCDMILARGLLAEVNRGLLEDDHQQVYWRRLDLTKEGARVFEFHGAQPLFDWGSLALVDRGLGKWSSLGTYGSFLVVRRDIVMELGGYDERMTGWGYYDDDLAQRLKAKGLQEKWGKGLKLLHLPHGKSSNWEGTWARNKKLSRISMAEGHLVRNGGLTNFDKYRNCDCSS